jgi:hypothetical protein
MGETKYNTSHHAGGTPEARIASRLRNSGDVKNSEHSVVHGTGPTRTYTNIHHSRVHEHGKPSSGVRRYPGQQKGCRVMPKQETDARRREVTDDDIAVIDKAISAHQGLGLFLYTTRRILGEIGKLEQHHRGLKQAIEYVQTESGRISSELEHAKAQLAEAQQQEVKTRQRVAELTAEAAEKERLLTSYSQTIDRITGKAA